MASEDERDAEDRAAILARRRRFIALAISGLATTACKRQAEPCLSVAVPEDPNQPPEEPGPFVEDPGAPLESDEAGDDDRDEAAGDEGVDGELEPPQPCLKMAAPKPRPKPCLKKRAPPQPCLLMVEVD